MNAEKANKRATRVINNGHTNDVFEKIKVEAGKGKFKTTISSASMSRGTEQDLKDKGFGVARIIGADAYRICWLHTDNYRNQSALRGELL